MSTTDTRTSDVESLVHKIMQDEVAGEIWYESRQNEKRLQKLLQNAEKSIVQALTSFREEVVAKERERIVVLAQVYAVLFAECGAKLDEMSQFIASMDTEYRFQGFLGFGGKVYKRNDGSFYVDCYPEDRTSDRQNIIDVANRRLSALTPPKETNK